MNKDMLDRLRSAVREGSQKSAEPRPDKAAVPMTTLVSTPSEAEDRIGPSFYSQADLDAARRAAEQLGYGIGLKPARANPPAVAVRHDELAARAEAEAVAALDLKESASILGIDPGKSGAVAIGEIAADAAIAASVAFQHGAPLETVRHALADRRAGPLGAALALIDAYQAQHKDSQQTGADF